MSFLPPALTGRLLRLEVPVERALRPLAPTHAVTHRLDAGILLLCELGILLEQAPLRCCAAATLCIKLASTLHCSMWVLTMPLPAILIFDCCGEGSKLLQLASIVFSTFCWFWVSLFSGSLLPPGLSSFISQ